MLLESSDKALQKLLIGLERKMYEVLQHYGLIEEDQTFSEENKIICLFHDDHDPSLSMNREVYRCWACRARGTIIDFVVHCEKYFNDNEIDEWQAILIIAQLKKNANKKSKKIIEKPKIKLNEKEAILFCSMFLDTLGNPCWEKLDHSFLKRGYTPEVLRHFDVKINQSSIYSTVIPIYQQSELKGYTARATDKKVKPKYKFNPGFDKDACVGGNITKGSVLVVEGYTDMMMAWQHGFENVCCLFGWYISDQQIAFIRQFATSIIDGLDEDTAGRDGGRRLQEKFEDLPMYRFPMRGKKDIGEMKRKNDFLISLYNIHSVVDLVVA
ncbi:MAG TPA: toprim domain-containing protein [Cyclobacteriaceae bacterium]|jgi:DNA primase|nr:toprim domain-containing protein [Cyclobacteriaceae bacterium]